MSTEEEQALSGDIALLELGEAARFLARRCAAEMPGAYPAGAQALTRAVRAFADHVSALLDGSADLDGLQGAYKQLGEELEKFAAVTGTGGPGAPG